MRRTILPLLAVLVLASSARAVTARLATARGVRGSGELVRLDGEEVHVSTAQRKLLRAPLGEIVGLDFPAAEAVESTGGEAELDEGAVEVLLAGDDRLFGRLVDGDEDTIELDCPVLGEVVLPLDTVRAIRFVKAGDAARRARPDREKDGLTFRTGDTLSGWVTSFSPDGLRIDCVIRDDYRVTFAQLAAVHLQQEMPPPPKDLVVRLTLQDGSRISARAPSLERESLRVRPVVAAEATWTIPLAAVRHLTVGNGAFAHLSDTTGWTAKVVPYFPTADPMIDPDEWLAPRRDRSFSGEALRLGGRHLHKGLGVVSGTTIRVPLGEAYREFRATVGVDDAAGDRGSVTFEILVDGRSRWRSPELRTGQKPMRVPPVDLSGAKILELRVGYGDDAGADVHDHADWGEAILVR